MRLSPTTLNTAQPMKKKVITALAVVLLGHVGLLWAVGQMQTLQLKPIEKKPVKVRFLTLKEDVPPPPAQVEPIKPKVEPKPVVEKKVQPKPEPKVIAQKVVPKAAKVLPQDDPQEKLKQQQELEKQRLDQLKREQELRDQQAREQALKEQQAREQESRNKTRKLDIGQIAWSRAPAISQDRVAYYFKPEDGEKILSLEISSDGTGKITNVRVTRSSGNTKFDSYAVKQTYAARFKAYAENGEPVPFTVPQSFAVSVVKK
ncbi:MAG: TonB family protein [Acinetobacter sp.]|nr:TonB family protein [Acinetobacter sp.]MBP7218105.1 TonB family protein [Acinetobacter sp.]